MAQQPENTVKTCFVIGPIGAEGTPERVNADWVFDAVQTTLKGDEFGYAVDRADKGGPGQITEQIINAILGADLVVADLTGQNPNAMYELCIAHMAEKPVVQLMTTGEELPFDNQDSRTVFYDRSTVQGFKELKKEIARQTKIMVASESPPSNPVTAARAYRRFAESSDSDKQFLVGLADQVAALHNEVARINRTHGAILSRSSASSAVLDTISSLRTFDPDQLAAAQQFLHRTAFERDTIAEAHAAFEREAKGRLSSTTIQELSKENSEGEQESQLNLEDDPDA